MFTTKLTKADNIEDFGADGYREIPDMMRLLEDRMSADLKLLIKLRRRMEKQYIRGNTDTILTECKNCKKKIVKNSDKQIVYFCSKQCRKEYRS